VHWRELVEPGCEPRRHLFENPETGRCGDGSGGSALSAPTRISK
jgi:hypothetical protein